MSTTLEELVAPMPVAQFLNEYLHQRTVHLRAPSRGRLSALRMPLRQLAQWATDPDPTSRRAQVYDAKGQSHDLLVQASELEGHFRAGMSVHVAHLQRSHPDCARLATRLKAELGYSGRISCATFMSPRGGGFPMHFDEGGAFTYQLEGTKRWRYSRARAMKAPPAGVLHRQSEAGFAARFPWARYTPPEDAEFDEVTLEPGDVLYVPAGTWHEPRAGDFSVAVTFGLHDVPVSRLLLNELEQRLFEDERWRAPLPPAGELRGFLLDRIGELSARVGAMSPEDLGIELGPVEAGEPSPSMISPEDRLSIPHRLEVLRDFDETGGDMVMVRNRFREVVLSLDALPFLQRLVAVEQFTAGEALGWGSALAPYSWAEIAQALEGLIEAGMVRHGAAPTT